jgi:mannose-6-phosphate isomerase-like protein (cupin superfamily)
MYVIAGATRFTSSADGRAHWREHFRTGDLSVGTYSIPAGGADGQSPHSEDEIYVVLGGRAVLQAGGESEAVAAGSVVFVPAGEPHAFTEVVEDLTVLVVFGPAEFSRRNF